MQKLLSQIKKCVPLFGLEKNQKKKKDDNDDVGREKEEGAGEKEGSGKRGAAFLFRSPSSPSSAPSSSPHVPQPPVLRLPSSLLASKSAF